MPKPPDIKPRIVQDIAKAAQAQAKPKVCAVIT